MESAKYHTIESISVTGDILTFRLKGKDHTFKLSIVSSRLAAASNEVKEQFVLSPSGYGIHWPMIDEDLSIDGLLGITHTPESQNSEFRTNLA
jgi:hypothetical protein